MSAKGKAMWIFYCVLLYDRWYNIYVLPRALVFALVSAFMGWWLKKSAFFTGPVKGSRKDALVRLA